MCFTSGSSIAVLCVVLPRLPYFIRTVKTEGGKTVTLAGPAGVAELARKLLNPSRPLESLGELNPLHQFPWLLTVEQKKASLDKVTEYTKGRKGPSFPTPQPTRKRLAAATGSKDGAKHKKTGEASRVEREKLAESRYF
eukprot:3666066-Amphidinium_carterae.1